MSALAAPATVTTSAGDVAGRWWWDPARPWAVHLTIPDPRGGFLEARIGRYPLWLVLRHMPLAVCRPDVQVWLDGMYGSATALRVQLNPNPAPGQVPAFRARRWSTSPAVAGEFLADTEQQVAICFRPAECRGCPECDAISERMAVLTARRGVS